MNLPNELFTLESLATFSGLIGIVFILCNSIKMAFNFMAKWLVLLISIIVSLFAVYQTSNPELGEIAMGIINGCLLFITSIGSNSLLNNKLTLREELIDPFNKDKKQIKIRRNFFQSWF